MSRDTETGQFREQLLRLLDGDLDKGETYAIQERLRSDRRSREILRDIAEQAVVVADEIRAGQCRGELRGKNPKDAAEGSRSGRMERRQVALTAALAMVSVLALVGTLVFLPNKAQAEFAVVSQAVGARWPDGDSVRPNRAVGAGMMEIAVGLIRIDFSSGASMTVEAPAKFEVRSSMEVFFERGIATFQVPGSAKGFRVETADAEVIDLGTAFGLARIPGEKTDVCVFEGEVEVSGKLLKEGEAVQVRSGSGVEPQVFETSQFENAWPVTSGVLQTTGMMRFVSPGPGFVPGKFEDNEHITVFLERRQTRINHPVPVDLTDPGEFRRLRRKDGPMVSTGVEVRSYLIQLDPVGLLEKYDGDKPRVQGQITFDRPIVGLIASGRKLLETDAALGHPRGDYGSLPRGLEPPRADTVEAESEGKDIVILAADQRTLILNFAAGSAVDHLRVLVEVETN